MRCHILLTPLVQAKEQESGYSTKGLKYLTGSGKVNPQLSFTRNEFIHELPKAQRGMSISGYQPKLQMVVRDGEFAVVEHQGEYILKPSPAEFPHLAENEHATMRLMSRLGFDVPPHGLVSFAREDNQTTPELAFVIRRFDRDIQTGAAIHQEQLDAAMNVGEKYGKTGSDGKQNVSYQQLAEFLTQHVNSNLAFKIDLFRRIAYAYLLGNNDMHLRNFGLIHPRIGEPTLSPVYDFVSVAPYPAIFSSGFMALPLLSCEEGDRELAPGFKTAYGEYLGMDFRELGLAIGLTDKLIVKLLSDLQKESRIVEAVYRDSFMPPEAIDATLRCYYQRLDRLMRLDEAEL
ncbi:serine/threonine-protein kinase HipA [Buttiauxella sp. BIGb0471]|uniref:type II toxin-antitoxin system HipA family toxin n=1 Tax=Buttiauxella sp. BIGb0471 TaxID=2940597 RepID=UPI00216A920E|nr:HipA domain-containing protein [Buttiauxella sp. BIGb0471]MCS3601870.1 serine/threonine-protein kinase HipA [Buttiauxella sp. BIGb0471]